MQVVRGYQEQVAELERQRYEAVAAHDSNIVDLQERVAALEQRERERDQPDQPKQNGDGEERNQWNTWREAPVMDDESESESEESIKAIELQLRAMRMS